MVPCPWNPTQYPFDASLITLIPELSFILAAGCHEVLGNSLFLVGEIGGNDFNYPLFIRNSIAEIKTYVPHVVNAITSTINVRLFCFTNYLSLYESLMTDLFEFHLYFPFPSIYTN